jgi:hypothetical protein
MGGLQETLKIYVMNSWTGGSELWLTDALETDEIYHVWHCTQPKDKIWSRHASWSYSGKFGKSYDWMKAGFGLFQTGKAASKPKCVPVGQAAPKGNGPPQGKAAPKVKGAPGKKDAPKGNAGASQGNDAPEAPKKKLAKSNVAPKKKPAKAKDQGRKRKTIM